MIKGIGTDIVAVGRIRKALETLKFRKRVYTEKERAYCESRGMQKAQSYAARFAGKEAVLKAFGTGLRGGTLQEIEILPDALGCPQVALSGYFADLAAQRNICKVWVSLSHTGEYAAAQCVMEGQE